MSLREKQSLFAILIAKMISWIYDQGWQVTCGDFARMDHAGHMENSCHYLRLAADLNLFVDGAWKDRDCPEWQKIGAHWKTLDAAARWGGDFRERDLNHFSLEHHGFM